MEFLKFFLNESLIRNANKKDSLSRTRFVLFFVVVVFFYLENGYLDEYLQKKKRRNFTIKWFALRN